MRTYINEVNEIAGSDIARNLVHTDPFREKVDYLDYTNVLNLRIIRYPFVLWMLLTS